MQDHNSQARAPRGWPDTAGHEYAINARGGTYIVWVRRLIPAQWGRQLGGDLSNSAWIGVDAAVPDLPVDDAPAPAGQWGWVRAAAPLRLAAGAHTLTLRTREGGYAIDQILLTTDPAFVPR